MARKLQSQGVDHVTITGAGRQTSIGAWEGVLGMPLAFEQPNLDYDVESHRHFDLGDCFKDPLARSVELASYRVEPPAGHTHADVLPEAHKLRTPKDPYG